MVASPLRSLKGAILTSHLAIICLVFLLVGGLGSAWLHGLAVAQLDSQVRAISKNLQGVIPPLLVGHDPQGEALLNTILEQYYRFDIVAGIQVIASDGVIYAQLAKPDLVKAKPGEAKPGEASFVIRKTLRHHGTYAGELQLTFHSAPVMELQERGAYLLLALLFLLLLTVTASSLATLKYLLERPLARLGSQLRQFSDSLDFTMAFSGTPLARELQPLVEAARHLGVELIHRQKALQQLHAEQVFLNDAILTLMTAGERQDLIKLSLQLLIKVTPSTQGLFHSYEHLMVASLGEGNSPLPSLHWQEDGNTIPIEPQAAEVIVQHSQAFSLRSAFPLTLPGQLQRGCFYLALSRPLQGDEQRLVQVLTTMSEQALLRRDTISANAMTLAKLTVAHTVQRSMLPSRSLSLQGADLAWYYRPVDEVGGDWFHVAESSTGRYLYLLMGDVTGHGIASGLVTTAVAGALHGMDQLISQLADAATFYPPEAILTHLDALIRRIAGASSLRMTCAAIVIDHHNEEVVVANAGHTFPLLCQKELGSKGADAKQVKISPLNKNQGPMLGEFLPTPHSYRRTHYPFPKGSCLLLYTDGLSEASDHRQRPFYRLLLRLLGRQSFPLQVKDLERTILQYFAGHTQGGTLHDDVCLVIAASR